MRGQCGYGHTVTVTLTSRTRRMAASCNHTLCTVCSSNTALPPYHKSHTTSRCSLVVACLGSSFTTVVPDACRQLHPCHATAPVLLLLPQVLVERLLGKDLAIGTVAYSLDHVSMLAHQPTVHDGMPLGQQPQVSVCVLFVIRVAVATASRSCLSPHRLLMPVSLGVGAIVLVLLCWCCCVDDAGDQQRH